MIQPTGRHSDGRLSVLGDLFKGKDWGKKELVAPKMELSFFLKKNLSKLNKMFINVLG